MFKPPCSIFLLTVLRRWFSYCSTFVWILICARAFNNFVATFLCWFILPGIVIISLGEEGAGCCFGCQFVSPRFCGFTFYDSSLWCQRRAAIFDCDTPRRSLHCFIEFRIHLKSTKSTKFKFMDGTLINSSRKAVGLEDRTIDPWSGRP